MSKNGSTPVSTPGYFPSLEDLTASGRTQEELHARAQAAVREEFGRTVFVRGVIEISNFCRQNCSYCGMRRDNKELRRFRAEPDILADLILQHRPASMTDLNIQAGEDPVAIREVVLPLLRRLRSETDLGLSVCLGSLPVRVYDSLREAGASIYILKFETGDPGLYRQLQCPGLFEDRLAAIRYLAGSGWNVSSGFIAGLPGQGEQELLSNFHLAWNLPLSGCSVSPFIPGDETPLASAQPAPLDLTLNSMAALRLMRPDWVIPAVSALNLSGANDGYRRGLRTGANLATINLTPDPVRGDYLLYKRDRVIMNEEKILSAIEAEGLVPGKMSLQAWYQNRRNGTHSANLVETTSSVV